MIQNVDRVQLGEFLRRLNAQNWGMWPAPEVWPNFGVAYTVSQYGGPTTVAKFDAPVSVAGEVGTRFGVGKTRRCDIRGLISV